MRDRGLFRNGPTSRPGTRRLVSLGWVVLLAVGACAPPAPEGGAAVEAVAGAAGADDRPYLLERVGDAAVVQVYADGFEGLGLREQTLVYHLYQAALAGRDIYWDQHYEHNLEMRAVLEEILTHAGGIEAETLSEIERYTKLVWLNTGPYNNLTARKFVLETTPEAFAAAARVAQDDGASFPLQAGEDLAAMLERMEPLFFDPQHDPVLTNKTPGPGRDILEASANNLYKGVTVADLEGFEETYGLNSRLVKQGDRLIEEVYRIDGKYGAEIREIVGHLEAAIPHATDPMAEALRALIQWYRTGEDADRLAYDIAWVRDVDSPVDTINGFIEVYMDPRGVKGSWEGVVFYVNQEKTRDIERLAAEAQWFEDRMPWDPAYRKEGVTGITANAIDVVVATGDGGPISPIGINLPNDSFVREQHGSKSVSLANVIEAYENSATSGFRTEFSWSDEEAARAEEFNALAGELTTNMHEVIGHASGKLAEHVQGNPQALLREHYSALEEGRADLVALYFIADPKLVELGLVAAEDHEDVVRTEYEGYTRNALVQLRRVREGTQIEQDHMRNRQMIVHWLMANTDAIERRERDGATYYVMVDAEAFREGVGRLLADVQRIKSEGDYEAARDLFETYGIHFDPALRDEVVARVDALELPSYTGFVYPQLEAERDAGGAIVGVEIVYPQDLKAQMLGFSGRENGNGQSAPGP